MTWTLLHERMAFMAEVIKVAETDPEAALAVVDNAPEVSRLFGDGEGLLLSLGQRWITTLVAKLDQAAHEGVSAEQVRADLEAARPGLYALVKIGSRRSLRMRSLSRGEHVAVGLFGGPTAIGRPLHDRLLTRITGRYALLIVSLWVLAAAVANLVVPQLERVVDAHARSFMPVDAPSAAAASRAAQLFDQTPSNNFVYVVLERNQRLTPGDHQFYDALTTSLASDRRNVYAVTDLWSQPATAAGAQSPDGRAVSVMVRLAGMLGTSQARNSVNSVRHTVAGLSPPPGLEVHVTGPGATIVDEFSAIDHQMLGITAATVGLILLLLLLVYRSPITAAIPLISVGLGLAVTRAVAAALGQANVVEVSLFSVALMAAMTLGAGTDYAIFLVGRYHEGRRRGVAPARALADAYRAVAPVVIGSALIVSVALACLAFAKVGSFRSAGLPCAVGILVTMAAALTLTPALMGLAVRRGFLEPRPSTTARRWRRVGTAVARWPGPILVAAAGLTLLAALPLAGMRVGWNEPAATPSAAESNRGYVSAGRHFPPNALLPDVVTIQADHDLRSPAGLIAVERITRQIMAVPGVRTVQSASRPDGKVPDQATLSYQAGVLGHHFGDTIDSLTRRLNGFPNSTTPSRRPKPRWTASATGCVAAVRDWPTCPRPQAICAPAWMDCSTPSRRCRVTSIPCASSLRELRTASRTRSARRSTGCSNRPTGWCRRRRDLVLARRS